MKKGDLLVIFAVVLLITAGFLAMLPTRNSQGGVVTVTLAGKKTAEYPIDTDFETEITTEHGKNTLVIKDGYADITAADCYGNDCVHQKRISKNGEMIVCLPHKLVVEITSYEESENDF